MTDPMAVAIEARESAKAAHHRLDRMNGSIDRLSTAVGANNDLCAQILQRLAREDGREEGIESTKLRFLDDKRFWIGIVAILLTSSLTLFLFTLATRRHS